MPDFDVQALSLATPPAPAPVATYRPAVRVRNNGTGPASVTGYLRVYRREPPGDLLASFTLSLNSLAAGQEGNALADGYWTPTEADIGREYLFAGYVTTENDQDEPNNNLAPVTVIVTGEEPPPPPVVTAHATQHESGGEDPINVDGLPGQLAEDQKPEAHATKHQAGQADELNVGSLRGQLAEPQTPAGHGNERHTESYTTDTDLLNHDTSHTAHTESTNLEHTSRRNAAGGYAGLDVDGEVGANQLSLFWAPRDLVPMLDSGPGQDDSNKQLAPRMHIHRAGGGLAADKDITPLGIGSAYLSKKYPAGYFSSALQYALKLRLGGVFTAAPGDQLIIRMYAAPSGLGTFDLGQAVINIAAPTDPLTPFYFEMDTVIQGGRPGSTFDASTSWRFTWNDAAAPDTILGRHGTSTIAGISHVPEGSIVTNIAWSGIAACTVRTAAMEESCDLVKALDV